MAKQTRISWTGNLSFDAHTDTEHHVLMDAHPKVGGEDKGPRPTDLLLAALGGCTGIDVASILRKMRVPFDRFEIAVEADQETEHPRVFTAFRLVFCLWGENVPEDRYRRAVELSQEVYCSVTALLRKAAPVSYRLELNGKPLE